MGAIPRHSAPNTMVLRFFWSNIVKPNQAPGLVHGFAHLTFQKCSERPSLLTFWSARYLLSILPTWSSKSAPSFWNANRALTTVLCALCRQLSHIQPRNPRNRCPTSATPGATLPERTGNFAPESAFNREFALFHCVVDMMMWLTWWWVDMMIGLTWWCSWHDGVDVKKLPTYGWWSWWMLT